MTLAAPLRVCKVHLSGRSSHSILLDVSTIIDFLTADFGRILVCARERAYACAREVSLWASDLMENTKPKSITLKHRAILQDLIY